VVLNRVQGQTPGLLPNHWYGEWGQVTRAFAGPTIYASILSRRFSYIIYYDMVGSYCGASRVQGDYLLALAFRMSSFSALVIGSVGAAGVVSATPDSLEGSDFAGIGTVWTGLVWLVN
jgi:hypothetical protein